jgi:hypothetical protein
MLIATIAIRYMTIITAHQTEVTIRVTQTITVNTVRTPPRTFIVHKGGGVGGEMGIVNIKIVMIITQRFMGMIEILKITMITIMKVMSTVIGIEEEEEELSLRRTCRIYLGT